MSPNSERNDKEDYKRLCAAVREIDEQAYQYLISEECTKHPSFNYSIRLTRLFIFQDSPQGGEYWIEIARKLKPPYIRKELYQPIQKIEKFVNEVAEVRNELQNKKS